MRHGFRNGKEIQMRRTTEEREPRPDSDSGLVNHWRNQWNYGVIGIVLVTALFAVLSNPDLFLIAVALLVGLAAHRIRSYRRPT
jgi:hypothetical protein